MSLKIKDELIERAKDFQIILDDVAITDTGFSPRFTQVNILELGQGSTDYLWQLSIQSIEQKQIAQQQAFQAQYTVQEAKQTKQEKIVAAQGDAER